MANGDVSFPKIADSSWWKLRDLFKKKVPAIVTPTYLASALSMGEASANSNLIGPFKKIGIIDNDGKPTDLAYDWRDDSKYQLVCNIIIEKYYPQEIRDLFHSTDANPQQLTNWFMSHARCGEPAAKMFARFYLLLLSADIKGGESVITTKTTIKTPTPKKPKDIKPKKELALSKEVTHTSVVSAPENNPHTPSEKALTTKFNNSPELHINIQLHISPESSADQIDKIFESMAKHLKDFNK